MTCTIENIRDPEVPKVGEVTLLKFCAPRTDGGLFSLRLDDVKELDQPCGGQVGPVALLPGTYHAVVGETAGSGTDLSDYTSVIGGACGKDGSIHVTAGASETCTITNVRRGTPTAVLTVHKICRPAHDNGRFVLDINEESFRGMRCGQSTGAVTVAIGTNLVGEVGAPPDIANRYITEYGGDCGTNGTITLRARERATCTVTNIRIRIRHPVVRPRPPKPPPPAVTGRRGLIATRPVQRAGGGPTASRRLEAAGHRSLVRSNTPHRTCNGRATGETGHRSREIRVHVVAQTEARRAEGHCRSSALLKVA